MSNMTTATTTRPRPKPPRDVMTPAQVVAARHELGRLLEGRPLSQEAFGALVGTTLMTVSRWERGVHIPSPLSVAAIRRELARARSLAQSRANRTRPSNGA